MEGWKKELEIVKRTKTPITKTRLIQDLREIGVETGDVLIVHSSMSSVGWIVGGARTIIEALMEVLTEKGTLVMPSQGGATDPSG